MNKSKRRPAPDRPPSGYLRATSPVGKKSLFVLAASIAVVLASGATSRGQNFIWNGSASTDWTNGANWTPTGFPNGAGTSAEFSNGAANNTPTISGATSTPTTITTDTITFDAGAPVFNVTVDGSNGTTTTLTIDATGVVNNSSSTQTFAITGDGVNTNGSNTASITFSGAANAGMGSTTALPSVTYTMSAGGAVYFTGTSTGGTASFMNNGGTFDISQESAGSNVTVGSIGDNGTPGNFFLGGNTLTTGADNTNTTVTGVIADGGLGGGTGGILTKIGTGTLSLSGTNTYTGGTNLTNGGLFLNDTQPSGISSAIGTGTLTITNAGGGTTTTVLGSTTAGQILANNVSVQGNFAVATNVDAASLGSQNFSFAGTVALTGTFTVTGLTPGGQVHFTGPAGGAALVGSGGITLADASGEYTAFIYDGSGANTYTGVTTVTNNAFLVLSQATVVNGAVIGNIVVTAGGVAELDGVSNQIATTSNVTDNSTGINLSGTQFQGFELRNNVQTINNLFGDGTVGLGSGTLTVNGGNFTGNIVDGDFGTGGNLVMAGTGTLNLSGINTYTGTTTVNSGTLQAGSSTGFSPNSAFVVNSGGVLDINGFNPTVGSLAGSGIVTNTSATPGFLITGFTSASTSFTGSLQDGVGTLGLVKTGFGTQTLSNSTYSGATNVLEGVLQAGATTGFSPRSAYIISAPGFLDINGFNTTVGSLAGNGTVTNFSSTTATLTTGLDNTNTTFNGTIQDGSTATIALDKTGTGTMTLASSNTFSGGTTLQNGTLVVASVLALGTGNVTVAGGTLKASGLPADIQVGGNYKQTGGELDLRVGGNTGGSFDRLAVIGSASLGGRLSVSSLNGFIPTRGTDITIVTAGGGVNGRFQQVTGNLATIPQINLTLEYLADDVVLQFNGTTFADIPGLTPNQKAVATALDNAVINTKSDKVLDYLQALPTKSLPAAFDRIAPEEYGTIYQISVSSAKVQATSIENRLDSIHGRFPTGPGGPAGAPDANNPAAATQTSLGGVYANATGEFVSIGDSPIASGYNFSSGGVTVGADYRLNDNFVAGVLLNYTRTRADLESSGRLDADGIRGGVYASLFGSGAYVNAYLGAGYNDYNMQRTGLDATVRGNTNGGEFNGLVQGGYDAHFGAYTFGPVASVQYTYTGLSSLVEQGSIDPLNIDSYREQSVRTNVGVRATYEWHIGHYILTPEIRATYQHEFADVVDSVTAGMLFGGPRFTVAGPQIGRDSILLNAGFTLTITPQIAGYLFYDGELGRSNYQDNNLLLGFRYDF